MKRRKALKVMGAMVVCWAGSASAAEEKRAGERPWYESDPLDFQFNEAGINNLIIIRKNGEKITIPFSEIVDALK